MFEQIIKLHRDVYYQNEDDTKLATFKNFEIEQSNMKSEQNIQVEDVSDAFLGKEAEFPIEEHKELIYINKEKPTDIRNISDEIEFYARRYGGGMR